MTMLRRDFILCEGVSELVSITGLEHFPQRKCLEGAKSRTESVQRTFTSGTVISEMGSMVRLEHVSVTERKVLRGCFACGLKKETKNKKTKKMTESVQEMCSSVCG